MKKILLTGATGFIGRNIKESCLSEKYHIFAPDSKELNLLDEQSVADFFKNNAVDIVIHTAIRRCNRDSYNMDDIISTNLRMFFNLEYHKNRYQKFLHIGSGAVYDLRRSMEKVKEEDFLDQIPADLYGFSKYIIAKYIEKEPKFYDLRLFGIFGKYEDYTMRLISNLICNALLNNKLILNQNRIFDYLYIDDLITIMDFFIENEPHEKSYNLTPDHSISLLEIAGKIQNITQEKMPVEIKQEGLGLEYTGDNIRLKMFFPDIRFTSMDVAIQQLWNWYSNNKKMIHLMG